MLEEGLKNNLWYGMTFAARRPVPHTFDIHLGVLGPELIAKVVSTTCFASLTCKETLTEFLGGLNQAWFVAKC